MKKTKITYYAFLFISALFAFSCKGKKVEKSQELRLSDMRSSEEMDTSKIGLEEGYSFAQISSAPNEVILTGLDKIRLFAVYKIKADYDKNALHHEGTTYYSYDENQQDEEDDFHYFMPGMDVIRGFYLINIGHYNLETDSLSYFFKKPVLVRNLYFPGVKRDSLSGKAIHRDFFLVSVYDEDTNQDSIINNRDLRRFYYFNEQNDIRISLLPQGYSAIKSSYDYKNDIMYINARFDSNKNGQPEGEEPISIFLIHLDNPTSMKKIV